jgi:sialidase-1
MNMRFVFLVSTCFLLTAMTCNKETAITDEDQVTSRLIINGTPILKEDSLHMLANLEVYNGSAERKNIENIIIHFSENIKTNQFISVSLKQNENIIGKPLKINQTTQINTPFQIEQGKNQIQIFITPNKDLDLLTSFTLKQVEVVFKNKKRLTTLPDKNYVFRPYVKVRKAGQDNCDTYRIPGIITTNSGTLIAVYDNRYNNSADLQEDVDIGMSRSTDGGNTWEPMKVIMDMGEWGGRPQNVNGIGDPSILYDPYTNTIWVAALWMSGLDNKKRLWWSSGQGTTPEETGQFILVKSTDDGVSWSEPVNITNQIKNPEWQLLLQGPGMGITLLDGTLVFPAQYKADLGQKALDGGNFTCHSTIVYSKDKGNTWQIGAGAKSNTTEAQVVQLTDESLMLNMRDDRNRKDKSNTNGRAVSVTKDLGKTWSVHTSSNSLLQEPNCMASLISANIRIDGKMQKVLFFSNPADKNERINMTLKASLDEGNSWPEKNQILLNTEKGFGYSCLTMVDENTIGILYEGTKELYFQKISIGEILKK